MYLHIRDKKEDIESIDVFNELLKDLSEEDVYLNIKNILLDEFGYKDEMEFIDKNFKELLLDVDIEFCIYNDNLDLIYFIDNDSKLTWKEFEGKFLSLSESKIFRFKEFK
jgi:hypothetical protein